jgi:hypothetical protein
MTVKLVKERLVTETPSASFATAELAAEFMDYLDETAAGERVEAVLVAVWTEGDVFWQVRRPGAEDDDGADPSSADVDALALALDLAQAALEEEER